MVGGIGHLGAAALALFREAEILQAESQPQYPLPLQGFRYCDLLLAPAERAAGSAGRPRSQWDRVVVVSALSQSLGFGRSSRLERDDSAPGCLLLRFEIFVNSPQIIAMRLRVFLARLPDFLDNLVFPHGSTP